MTRIRKKQIIDSSENTLGVDGNPLVVKLESPPTPNHNDLDGLEKAGSTVEWGHIDDQAQTIAGEKTLSSPVRVAQGTESLPGLTSAIDPATGIYFPSANRIVFSTAGFNTFDISTSRVQLDVQFRQANGSSSAPAYSFVGMADGGLFRNSGEDDLRMAINGVETFIWDDDLVECLVPFKSNGAVHGIQTTTTTETVNVSSGSYIRQTSSGITTSLSGFVTGSEVTIKNRGGGDNTVNLTIDGESSPTIRDKESFTIVFNGTDWDIK